MPSNLEDEMTEETYKNAVRALEIMDKYNSGDLSADEAAPRLESIQKDLDAEQIDDAIKNLSRTTISTDIFLFKAAMTGGFGSTYSTADELRDMLED